MNIGSSAFYMLLLFFQKLVYFMSDFERVCMYEYVSC
jgi:hypothetical protein